MKRLSFVLISLMAFSVALEAKMLVTSGSVVDNTKGLPIANAHVELLNRKIGVYTDENGKFRIEVEILDEESSSSQEESSSSAEESSSSLEESSSSAEESSSSLEESSSSAEESSSSLEESSSSAEESSTSAEISSSSVEESSSSQEESSSSAEESSTSSEMSSNSAEESSSSLKSSSSTKKSSSSSAKSSASTKKSSSSHAVEGFFANDVSRGYIRIDGGVLFLSQDSKTPVSLAVYDLMGNRIFSRILYGSGEIDLRGSLKSQGFYLARFRIGNELKTVKFASNGSKNISFSAPQKRVLLKTEEKYSDMLMVSATGYDTLQIALQNIDTTLKVILNAVVTEETFNFGYALKNEPTPSKGCGVNSTLKSTGQNSNAKKYNMTSAGLNREFWVTLPKNYDNTKPYKILFAMHCMGSNAEDFTNHSPDADHPSPYYGQQNLDKDNEFIFVAPRGDSDGLPWRTGDDKDHIFFDELLTKLEENYCIDTSRVFVTGSTYGAMVANSLAQVFQHRIRAVAVYAVADWNIYIPTNAGKPIAWMDVHGTQDNLCSYSRLGGSLNRILANNVPNYSEIPEKKRETAKTYSGGNTHVCYDFTTVDPRFPVKLCTWGGGNQWTAYDSGDWHNTWVPEEVHKFFEQF